MVKINSPVKMYFNITGNIYTLYIFYLEIAIVIISIYNKFDNHNNIIRNNIIIKIIV